ADWVEARKKAVEPMLTEWQVYRLFDAGRGAWASFQFLVRARLRDEGVAVAPDGTLLTESRSSRAASGNAAAGRTSGCPLGCDYVDSSNSSLLMQVSRSPGARTAGSGSAST